MTTHLFRHKDLAALRDTREEDPMDVEAGEAGLNFVKLDGNVACMVNGAGSCNGYDGYHQTFWW